MGNVQCPDCLGDGRIAVKGCTCNVATDLTLELLEAVDLAKSNHWPVGLGWLGEADSFVTVFRFVQAATDRISAKK